MPYQKEELWKIYTAKNPHWQTGNVTLTPAGLKKLFEQTFEQGHSLGIANGKALGARANQESSGVKNPFGDAFSGIWGDR